MGYFNLTGAAAGLLSGVATVEEEKEKRRRELEEKIEQEKIWERRLKAEDSVARARDKWKIDIEAEATAKKEGGTEYALGPDGKTVLTKAQYDSLPDDQKAASTTFTQRKVGREDAKWQLEQEQTKAQIEASRAQAANAGRRNPTEFEQKAAAIDAAIASGKLTEEEGKARYDALYGLKSGGGILSEAGMLRQEQYKDKLEMKAAEILDETGGKVTEENINQVNALMRALGEPEYKAVTKTVDKDGILAAGARTVGVGGTEEVTEYVQDVKQSRNAKEGKADQPEQEKEEKKDSPQGNKYLQMLGGKEKIKEPKEKETDYFAQFEKESAREAKQPTKEDMINERKLTNEGSNLIDTRGAKELGSAIKTGVTRAKDFVSDTNKKIDKRTALMNELESLKTTWKEMSAEEQAKNREVYRSRINAISEELAYK